MATSKAKEQSQAVQEVEKQDSKKSAMMISINLILNTNHKVTLLERIDGLMTVSEAIAKLKQTAFNKWRRKHKVKRKKIKLYYAGTELSALEKAFIGFQVCSFFKKSVCNVYMTNGERFDARVAAGKDRVAEEKEEEEEAIAARGRDTEGTLLKVVPLRALGSIIGRKKRNMMATLYISGACGMAISRSYRRLRSISLIHKDIENFLKTHGRCPLEESKVEALMVEIDRTLEGLKQDDSLVLLFGTYDQLDLANEFVDRCIRRRYRRWTSYAADDEEVADESLFDFQSIYDDPEFNSSSSSSEEGEVCDTICSVSEDETASDGEQ